MYIDPINQNELNHHGILGMKWGVRRYQNKDGSLTAAGMKRYGYDSNGNLVKKGIIDKAFDRKVEKLSNKTSSGKKMTASDSDSTVTKRVKKDYNNLSDAEFFKKYSVTKERYAKRVKKYGDPYMNSPLAKLGKRLAEKNKKQSLRDDDVVRSIRETDKEINKMLKEIGNVPMSYVLDTPSEKTISALNKMDGHVVYDVVTGRYNYVKD